MMAETVAPIDQRYYYEDRDSRGKLCCCFSSRIERTTKYRQVHQRVIRLDISGSKIIDYY